MSDSGKPKSSWWDCMKTIEHMWHAPIVSIEWVCWRVSPFLRQLSFLEVLEYLSRLAVVVAVIFYIWGCEDRQKAKHYQAWQVINLAQGKTGSGGRKDALQDLHKDGIDLSGVDVSQAYLPQLDLQNAYLWKANFSKANLFGAILSHAVLQNANLSDADVSEANLSRVLLTRANLSKTKLSFSNLIEAGLFEADVSEANLWGANLWGAKLVNTNLSRANLLEANLSGANLHGANVSGTNFSGANLWKSNLRGIKNWQDIKSMEQTNIFDVENPPDGFIEWAKEHGAITIDEEWKTSVREIKYKQTKDK